MTELSPAIQVRDLRKVYGDKAAVDGLNLPVTGGTFFGLLGLPMPGSALEIKKLIGLVPDESLLFDHLTGGEFIEFVGRIYGLERLVARERSVELLELFELDGTR